MTTKTAAALAAIDEFERLQSAAFPGPWWRTDPPWGNGETVHAGPSNDPHLARIYVCEFNGCDQQFSPEFDEIDSSDIPEYCKTEENFALIAEARNTTLPALCRKAIEELQAERDALNAAVSLARSALEYPPNGYNYCRWCSEDIGPSGMGHSEHCNYVQQCKDIDEARAAIDAARKAGD